MLPSANSLTFEYHDSLNPLIWQNSKLRPEIKEKLLEVAEAFLEFIEITIDIEDITFTGSLANFNYTQYSDIDLHIITDFSDYSIDKDLLKDYFKAKKTVWNSSHNIKIKNYDVEAYIQDSAEPHHSTGVYSIKHDDWLVKPVKAGTIDKKALLKKVESIKALIDHALSDKCDVECAENVKDKILKMRQAGLNKAGEFSIENLAFKELKRSKDIDKLVHGVIAKRDEELSLSQENFKTFLTTNGIAPGGKGSRGKRHQSDKAGVTKMTNINNTGSVSMVAKMHSDMETPFHEIENLKKKEKGKTYLIPQTARAIARWYNINMDKVPVEPRGLSTSGIVLGYDPMVKRYYLSK
jgi:predicted nucleotidyltransferase